MAKHRRKSRASHDEGGSPRQVSTGLEQKCESKDQPEGRKPSDRGRLDLPLDEQEIAGVIVAATAHQHSEKQRKHQRHGLHETRN
jgi:hypothetical protein